MAETDGKAAEGTEAEAKASEGGTTAAGTEGAASGVGAGKEAKTAGESGDDQASGDAGSQKGKKDDGSPPDWREARLRVETAKRREAEAKLRELEAKQAAKVAESPAAKTLTEADVDRLADQKAAMRHQWQVFSDACEATAVAGQKEFTDFNERVGEIRRLVDSNDPDSQGAYNRFLAAAIETGEATKILHALGGNLNEAQRIMSLPPVKMAVEMTKLAMSPEKALSKAPKPINAINSRGANHVQISPDDPDRADNLTTAEWIKRREAQVAERVRR